MTIEEQNEIIARYMDHYNAYKTVNTRYGVSNSVDSITASQVAEYKKDNWQVSTDRYHQSWDTLIPVYTRVLKDMLEMPYPEGQKTVGDEWVKMANTNAYALETAAANSEIEVLHQQMIRAMQWINSKKDEKARPK